MHYTRIEAIRYCTGRTILQMGLSLLNLQAFVFIPHSFKVPSQKHAPAKRLQWALAASSWPAAGPLQKFSMANDLYDPATCWPKQREGGLFRGQPRICCLFLRGLPHPHISPAFHPTLGGHLAAPGTGWQCHECITRLCPPPEHRPHTSRASRPDSASRTSRYRARDAAARRAVSSGRAASRNPGSAATKGLDRAT